MQKFTPENKIEKIASFNGMEIYHLKTDKFKTNTINFFFHDNLSRETAALNALVPAVLRRGCGKFPTFQEVALYLEELYGATFDCGVSKKGERQIIQFYMEFVSDKYTGKETAMFDKAFDLLYELVTAPVLENEAFKKEFVEQEKDNLIKLIESRVNDKVQYAVDRCFELMCSEEPFGVYEYGSVEDFKGIDGKKLYKRYRYFLERLPVSIFITGNIPEVSISRMLDKLKALKRGEVKALAETVIHSKTGEVKNAVDSMSVNQGKLSLGFRTNIPASSRDYYSLLVYNGILGGGVHSKLFQNVREKASLAYYAFSRLEKFKELMVISSGIEMQNRDKAYEIIIKQLEEIKSGNISDYEFDSTIKSIETGMESLKDNQLSMVDFYLSQLVAGTNDNFDTIIDRTKRVTKQDVIDVSNKIRLDTVYFLNANQ